MTPELNKIYLGDCIETMRSWPDGFVQTCVTSPPYWGLRDYGVDGQIGLEEAPEQYVAKMVAVFREVKRVLRDDGTLWLNLGDTYTAGIGNRNGLDAFTLAGGKDYGRGAMGAKPRGDMSTGLRAKNIVGIPWRVAFSLQAEGWILRQDIIWSKPNPMPESVTDRCTKAHEYIFLLAKSEKYYYDHFAIQEKAVVGFNGSTFDGDRDLAVRPTTGRGPRFGGRKYPENGSDGPYSGNEYAPDGMRNKRSVWEISPKPFSEAHFATFPEDLIKPCIMAGSARQQIVLDPFMGAGTTALVAASLDRQFLQRPTPRICGQKDSTCRGGSGMKPKRAAGREDMQC